MFISNNNIQSEGGDNMTKEVKQFDLSSLSNDEIKNIDFKDCILMEYLLNEENGNSKYANIKKWLQYDLFAKEDADVVLKKSDILIQNLKWYDKSVIMTKRYLDCIFSMTTHFNMFLRLFEPQAAFSHSWLLYYFDEVFSEKNIKEFCEINKIKNKSIMNCLSELDKFAKNTHTIGNYMPCPDKTYNVIKGYKRGFVVFNDRIELLIQELKKREHTDYINSEYADKWKEWFDENAEKLCLEGLFKGNFKKIENSNLNDSLVNFPLHKRLEKVYKFECKEIDLFKNYLKFVNEWIETRGENLLNSTQ